MGRRDQRGVTLIELLAVIVLLGVVTVPLFAAFSDSYKRTVDQGQETHLLYFAASVMDNMKGRTDLSPDRTVDGIHFEIGECKDGLCQPTVSPDQNFPTYTVEVKPYDPPSSLLEIVVHVFPAKGAQRQAPVRLVTVVEGP